MEDIKENEGVKIIDEFTLQDFCSTPSVEFTYTNVEYSGYTSFASSTGINEFDASLPRAP